MQLYRNELVQYRRRQDIIPVINQASTPPCNENEKKCLYYFLA